MRPIRARHRRFKKRLPSQCTLDGELWAGRGKFRHAVGVARSAQGDWHQLTYQVFDAPVRSACVCLGVDSCATHSQLGALGL